MSKKQNDSGEVTIEQISTGKADIWVRGISPLIYNAMSAKARHELLMPKGKKTTAEKANSLKHEPVEEYRNSVYKREGSGATRLVFPATAFKNAAVGAIRHIPNSGTNMTAMRQLLWVSGDVVDVYGTPQLFMSVVRSSDMNKTPDVRTRAILTEWCCCVRVQYVMPTLNETTLARLFDAAGLLIGVGDFRQEKGKGNYGQFQIVSKSDCEDIIKGGGLKDQDKALKEPSCYDIESRSLLEWFIEERARRGK